MRSMLRGEHIINEVFAFVHAGTGKSGFVRYTSIPVTDAAGAVTSVICLWADVTVEMAAEAQLLELRSSKETMRVRQADRASDIFDNSAPPTYSAAQIRVRRQHVARATDSDQRSDRYRRATRRQR